MTPVFLDGYALSLIGILAGVLILSGWVKQIVKGYQTKSLRDVSRYLMALIAAGAALWLVYGAEVQDWYIIGTNLTAIILMAVVLAMKHRYDGAGGGAPPGGPPPGRLSGSATKE